MDYPKLPEPELKFNQQKTDQQKQQKTDQQKQSVSSLIVQPPKEPPLQNSFMHPQAFNIQSYVQPIFQLAKLPFVHMKNHIIRKHKPWKDLLQQTIEWVNTNIYVGQVLSITTVYCHTTGAKMCTIYYNEAIKDPDNYNELKKSFHFCLDAKLVETNKTWDKHHEQVSKMLGNMGNNIGVINICQLESGGKNEKAVTVIWHKRVY